MQDRPDANGPRGADGELSRRRFLRITGAIAGVSLAMPLLEACAPTLPAPANRSATTGTATAPASSVYPTYLAPANAPKADFPADGQQYDDAFDNYPKNPVKALPAEPPGTGGNVKIMSIQLFPPPTPFAQNPAWQAVNKELNANVQFEIVTSADYPVKLGTMMASSDLPDIIYMYARPGSNSALAAAAGVPQFLQAQAADLTPYLAGDAAKDYPFLAAIPTPAWKNSGSVYQGRLYMVPIHRYLPGQVLVKNVEVWDKEIGAGYVPKSAADFKRILQTLTNPQQDFYGIGGAQGTTMLVPRFAAMFGAPNGWKLDNGKLTKDYETAEYKETVNYVRDLWASGLFHPNSLNYASGVIARQNFAGRRFAVYSDPFNGWQDGWRQALQSSQPFDAHMIPPFPAIDGGKPGHYITGGHLWATAIKKATPERTREMLRILNWLAAPFGSLEDQLLIYGVKDVDWTFDETGNPKLTQQGNTDANYVPWKYTIQHPFVFFTPDIPNYAKTMYDAEHMLMPVAVSDPTFGQVSATNFSKGFTLQQAMDDGIVDIVVGRRPMSDFDQLVKDFLSNGGEAMRKEYEESIAATTT